MKVAKREDRWPLRGHCERQVGQSRWRHGDCSRWRLNGVGGTRCGQAWVRSRSRSRMRLRGIGAVQIIQLSPPPPSESGAPSSHCPSSWTSQMSMGPRRAPIRTKNRASSIDALRKMPGHSGAVLPAIPWPFMNCQSRPRRWMESRFAAKVAWYQTPAPRLTRRFGRRSPTASSRWSASATARVQAGSVPSAAAVARTSRSSPVASPPGPMPSHSLPAWSSCSSSMSPEGLSTVQFQPAPLVIG
jgi:hypothetical protein